MKKELIKKIREDEWTMGNGQCGVCCGTKDGFNGHSNSYNEFEMGHKEGCYKGEMLEYLGEKVLWQRKSEIDKRMCSKCGKDLEHPKNAPKFCEDCGVQLWEDWGMINNIKTTYKEVL